MWQFILLKTATAYLTIKAVSCLHAAEKGPCAVWKQWSLCIVLTSPLLITNFPTSMDSCRLHGYSCYTLNMCVTWTYPFKRHLPNLFRLARKVRLNLNNMYSPRKNIDVSSFYISFQGKCPSPRAAHACATIGNRGYTFGGRYRVGIHEIVLLLLSISWHNIFLIKQNFTLQDSRMNDLYYLNFDTWEWHEV